ncbi:hypothetical protein [Arthrobacter sp. ES1]|uniref:hypothetical protein n=1 Tax=Arthrobacter sp. ES1 TaxID=1897056 RepID=UPI001CFF6B43|nr:hypothetical protein [Arthrobacter sp. ES1]MCB5280319.1 hypothetical protein [Arthrobacter sp. ES1]
MSDELEFQGPTWSHLVAETQFATELVLTGLRRLCTVPTDAHTSEWGGKDRNYALHVGLHAYSSGLERLCKLAIACNGYAANGKFHEVKKFGHKIGSLLDEVGSLTPAGPGVAKGGGKYLTRPVDALDPDLTAMVEKFASGAGRYEHLDSLWNDKAKVTTYDDWCAVAANGSVTAEVHDLIALKDAMTKAMRSELSEAGLESTSQPMIEELERPIFEPSVAVALSLYRKARWVAAILDVATYYTGKGLPLLGEVVNPILGHTSTNFFMFDIAGVSDRFVVEDELEEVYPRILKREEEWDEELANEG